MVRARTRARSLACSLNHKMCDYARAGVGVAFISTHTLRMCLSPAARPRVR